MSSTPLGACLYFAKFGAQVHSRRLPVSWCRISGLRYWRAAVVMLAAACPVVLSLACNSGETDATEVTVSASEGASLATDSGRFVLDMPLGAVSEDRVVRVEMVKP